MNVQDEFDHNEGREERNITVGDRNTNENYDSVIDVDEQPQEMAELAGVDSTTTNHLSRYPFRNLVEAVPVRSMIIVTASLMLEEEVEHTDQVGFDTDANDESRILNNNISVTSTTSTASALTAPTSTTRTGDDINKKKKISSRHTKRDKRYLYGIIIGLLFVMVVVSISIGIYYYLKTIKKRQLPKTSLSSTLSPTFSPTTSPAPTTLRNNKFTTREDLIQAIDNYYSSKNNVTKTIDDNIDTINYYEYYGDIAYWDVSEMTNFSSIIDFKNIKLQYVDSFQEDIHRWDVSNAIDMSKMFNGAANFTCDLSKWDVSNVQSFVAMFSGAVNFQSDLSKWNTSSATDMQSMFYRASKFQSDLSKWDVKNVISTFAMFSNAPQFTSDLSKWDIRNVQSLSNTFQQALNFTSDLSNWSTSQVTSLSYFAENTISFNSDLSKWDTNKVTSFDFMFTDAASFLGEGVDKWDVSKGQDFTNAFRGATIFDTNLSTWNTSRATDMSSMFSETTKFRGFGLDRWDLSQVTDTSSMFERAVAFNADLTDWYILKIVDMSNMFAHTTTYQGIGLNKWMINSSTAAVNGMFCNADALNTSFVSNWDPAILNETKCIE